MNFIHQLDLKQGDLFYYIEKYYIFIENVGKIYLVFSLEDLKITHLLGSFKTAKIIQRFN